jgi:serine/threonine protein kinase, bacterial
MMNKTWKSTECNICIGDVLQGKWNGNRYTVMKCLGSGATGTVYLVQGQREPAALKISTNSTSITSEVNVLRNFSKVQGCILGPSLLDVDDLISSTGKVALSFYVMEYVEGKSIYSFIQDQGEEWIFIFIVQVLSDLYDLHKAGWVFGDIKPDNLTIQEATYNVRWLDVGGVTLQGRAVKEFTEFFDRGYWELGTRRAEPSYDLFAVAMMMINIFYKGTFSKRGNGYEQLKKLIRDHPILHKVECVLLKALRGDYQSAMEMREELLRIIGEKRNRQRSIRPKEKSLYGWKETMTICFVVLIGYLLYIHQELL